MAKKNSTKRPDKIIPMSNKWIQEADLKTGAFTAQAKKAGMSVQAFARHVLKKGSKYNETTKRRARLAQTFKKMSKDR